MDKISGHERDLLADLDLRFPLLWLEDESLYSLCSRYHRYSVNPSARHTAVALFGSRHGGHAHDFPSHLDALESRTDGAIGSAYELILHRTIAPYFLPFRSPALGDLMLSSMRGTGIGSLKFQLGLLTSRFRATHPLKACRTCMHEDVQSGIPPYWRLSHQFPGVWVCEKHSEVLGASELKATGVDRFGFHLPDEGLARAKRDLGSERSVLQTAALLEFGRTCQRLGRTIWGTHFDADRLVLAFTYGLECAGLLAASGRLRGKEACKSLSAYSRAFGLIEELAGLVVSEERAYPQIQTLRTADRVLTHPLRHVFLINWLFGDWDGFLRAYSHVGVQSAPEVRGSGHRSPDPRSATSASATNVRQALCLELMMERGFSATRAAKETGVATATAMAWAATAGISVNRRPKRLSRIDRSKAVSALRQGADKATVAKRHLMSSSAIEVMLHTEPGLYAAWRASRQRVELERRRRHWVSALREFPNLSTKQLRERAPATYAWLYRNDRDWLTEQRTIAVRRRTNNAAAIDWQQRDERLAALIEARCGALLQGDRSPRASRDLALWEIYQLVPELKAKLRQLGRLPGTRAVVERLRSKTHGSDSVR